jgi:toxin ParE1/3/4
MPRLIVHDRVLDDVEEIAARIAQDNLPAALRFYDAAQEAFDFLAATPGAGPLFDPPLPAAPDLHFWPITRYRNFLVLYRPIAGGAEIVRVIHGARDIPRMFDHP